MFARLVALLLTVIVMTGAASAAPADDHPAGSVAAMVDNAPDSLELAPMITVRTMALALPISQIVSPFAVAPRPQTGRLHAVHVFRPPR